MKRIAYVSTVGDGLRRLFDRAGCTGWALRRYLIIRLPKGKWLILGAAVWDRDPLASQIVRKSFTPGQIVSAPRAESI
jgi:hypothetical protein